MILECLHKFIPTPSNHKAGGMRKEHPKLDLPFDDNANWTVIDTSGESGWARWETRRFDVGSFEATDITS